MPFPTAKQPCRS